MASVASDVFVTPRHEEYLGEIIAQTVERDYRVLHGELNKYLQLLGERILSQWPGEVPRMRFMLADLSDANGFALIGGRIYISRKLVVFSRSEDELAGWLGHEIGHLMTRHSAAEFSRWFKQALGISQLGDREDVERQYHKLLDNWDKVKAVDDDHTEQLRADEVGLLLSARAGYDPLAMVDAWDRLAEVKQKTGNWVTDMFRATKPEQKRLRELRRLGLALPPGCRQPMQASPEFEKWKAQVAAYAPGIRPERLRGVVRSLTLATPLRSSFSRLRYSPDGKLLLAQDGAVIAVMQVDPLRLLFQVDAENAEAALFTPDSKYLIFHTNALRVERHAIATRESVVQEVAIPGRCIYSRLSPDGRYLACVDHAGEEPRLRLIEVASNNVVFTQQPLGHGLYFFEALMLYANRAEGMEYVKLAFSPDGQYLVAARGAAALAVKLDDLTEVKITAHLKSLLQYGFTFMANGDIAARNFADRRQAGVFSFPEGRRKYTLTLGAQTIEGATLGDYLLVRPAGKYAVGLLDIRQNKVIAGSSVKAFDVFETRAANETKAGEIGLYDLAGGSESIRSLELPISPVRSVQAAAVSEDLHWLAFSQRERGAVWDLRKNRQVAYVRGFGGGHIVEGQLYGHFPEEEKTPRGIVRLELTSDKAEMVTKTLEQMSFQAGPHLIAVEGKNTPEVVRQRERALQEGKEDGKEEAEQEKLDRDITIRVRDVRDGQTRWSKSLPGEAPTVTAAPDLGTMVVWWPVGSPAAKAMMTQDPGLRARFEAAKASKPKLLVKVLALTDGREVANLFLPSLPRSEILGTKDWVVVMDNSDRILVYSTAGGEPRLRTFGVQRAVSPELNLLSVDRGLGRISLVDVQSGKAKADLDFGAPLAWLKFLDGGHKILALREDQKVFVLDTLAALQGSGALSH